MTGFVYAAHTTNAVFYLDAEGICRSVTPIAGERGPVSPELTRLVGAQYVAALDVAEPGGLVGVPKNGSALLFVHASPTMRFSLLRTAPVVAFEKLRPTIPPEAPALGNDGHDAAVEEAVAQALRLASMFEIKVTWPSADELARQLPLTRFGGSLMAAAAAG